MSRAPVHLDHPDRLDHAAAVRPVSASDAEVVRHEEQPPGDGPPRRPGGLVRRIGKAASVPLALAVVAASADPSVIRIHRGDTLWGLSQRFHTTVAALKRLNHLPNDTIYAGQTLLVPAPRSPDRPSSGVTTYRVRPGDTVSTIAAAFGVPVSAVAARNGLRGAMIIYSGQILRIPVSWGAGDGRHRPIARPPARRYPASVLAAAARHRAALALRPVPSRERVRGLIRRTARRLGVDPALALAVAEQESGFQTNVVSDADAIGVMQVLPSTGAWIGSEVLGRDLDLLDPHDNVLAGVTLLRILTNAAPLRQAVAGYYQGLASVRRNGMLPDTRRYVASVLALRQRWR